MNRLTCLKPTGDPAGSEEWRGIAQLAFQPIALAAVRILVTRAALAGAAS